MTEKELKKTKAEYTRFLLSLLSTLYNNNKVTFAEYSKIRDRILSGKEVKKWPTKINF